MSKLKVSGNASGTGVITLEAPNTNTDRAITLPDGDISFGVGIDDNATSTAITIDASENVGIGTTSPDGKLHIDGTSTTVTGLVLEAGTDGDCRSVDFHNTDGNKRIGIGYDNTNIKLNITDRSENKLVTIGELTGDVTVGTGNLVIGTSGKGIDFSADGNAAGMTSEVLDDYETGTWTPAWTAGASDATYVTQVGTYTKIGNKVHVQGRITISSIGTMSGALLMTGLPFTSSAATNNYSGLQVSQGSGLAITAGTSIGGYYPPSSTNIYVQLWDVTAGASGLTAAELSASGNIIFSVEYVTA